MLTAVQSILYYACTLSDMSRMQQFYENKYYTFLTFQWLISCITKSFVFCITKSFVFWTTCWCVWFWDTCIASVMMTRLHDCYLLLDDIDDGAEVGGVVVIDSSYNISNNFWTNRKHYLLHCHNNNLNINMEWFILPIYKQKTFCSVRACVMFCVCTHATVCGCITSCLCLMLQVKFRWNLGCPTPSTVRYGTGYSPVPRRIYQIHRHTNYPP